MGRVIFGQHSCADEKSPAQLYQQSPVFTSIALGGQREENFSCEFNADLPLSVPYTPALLHWQPPR